MKTYIQQLGGACNWVAMHTLFALILKFKHMLIYIFIYLFPIEKCPHVFFLITHFLILREILEEVKTIYIFFGEGGNLEKNPIKKEILEK